MAGVRIKVGDPDPTWVPVGPIVTKAKLVAAGVTTGYEPNGNMNVNFPTVFRKPSWWAGDPAVRDFILLFSSHSGTNIVMAHTDLAGLGDPESWTGWRVVLRFEDAVDLANDEVPDGVIAPVRQTIPNHEHLATPSVFVDDVSQKLWVLAHQGSTSRPNLGPHSQLGFTTPDLVNWTLHAPLGSGASKDLPYATYSRWVIKAGAQVGSDSALVVCSPSSLLRRSTVANWWAEESQIAEIPLGIQAEFGLITPMRPRHPCGFWEDEAAGIWRWYMTVNGDSPERVRSCLIAASDPLVSNWRVIVGSHREERRPLLDYEGIGMGGVPSTGGGLDGPQEQLRDPFVFEVAGSQLATARIGGTRYMVCAGQGEFTIVLYRWSG